MQAILPLRGKILNVERRDEASIYKNEEIQNLILALGLGVKVKLCNFIDWPLKEWKSSRELQKRENRK